MPPGPPTMARAFGARILPPQNYDPGYAAGSTKKNEHSVDRLWFSDLFFLLPLPNEKLLRMIFSKAWFSYVADGRRLYCP